MQDGGGSTVNNFDTIFLKELQVGYPRRFGEEWVIKIIFRAWHVRIKSAPSTHLESGTNANQTINSFVKIFFQFSTTFPFRCSRLLQATFKLMTLAWTLWHHEGSKNYAGMLICMITQRWRLATTHIFLRLCCATATASKYYVFLSFEWATGVHITRWI